MSEAETSVPLYFAYGSNLEPVQMAARAPGHRVVGRAVLREHALAFQGYGRDWAGAVATVLPSSGHDVHGVVFAITAAHYASLDGYEGYDGPGASTNLYERVPVRVNAEDGRAVDVLTYVMRPRPAGAPSRRYRAAILAGMRHHGLPAPVIAALESVPTAESLPHVLFVCIENSCRSQMAEGFARAGRHARRRVQRGFAALRRGESAGHCVHARIRHRHPRPALEGPR